MNSMSTWSWPNGTRTEKFYKIPAQYLPPGRLTVLSFRCAPHAWSMSQIRFMITVAISRTSVLQRRPSRRVGILRVKAPLDDAVLELLFFETQPTHPQTHGAFRRLDDPVVVTGLLLCSHLSFSDVSNSPIPYRGQLPLTVI